MVAAGDYEQAEARLAALDAAAGVNSQIGRKLRAFIALQRGEHATASRLYRAVLVDLPDDHESRYNAALAAFGAQEWATVNSLATPLLGVASHSERARQLLTQLAERRR